MANLWNKFKVGMPSKTGRVELDCQPLREISHVAHVPIALRIIEDEKIRTDLVFDKSILNDKRIRVVWLSPNDWSDGFRYGNIRFNFDWKSLIKGRQAYWVESIAYKVDACRILLTNKDYSSFLTPYDPQLGDGPWWVDDQEQHFWNGKYCLEIMVDEDVNLDQASSIDFVKHHDHFCNILPVYCANRGWSAQTGGAELLGSLASQRTKLGLPGLTQTVGAEQTPSFVVQSSINLLLRRLYKCNPNKRGSLVATDLESHALAKAVLRTLASDALKQDREPLIALFKSNDEAETAILEVLALALDLPNADTLRDD